jgi:HAD superfamily hydrolase (TIGR01490 family)
MPSWARRALHGATASSGWRAPVSLRAGSFFSGFRLLICTVAVVEPRSRFGHGVAAAEPWAAAFFDLDRTLISRATPLALAETFRRSRLLRRRDLLRAAAWQLIFLIRGVGADEMRRAAEDGMVLLRGVPVAAIEEMLGEAMERVLRPLLYSEPLALMQEHRQRGERMYIISASLQQIVQHIADDLGFDGAVGSTCEIVDGVYTGRSLRPCYGSFKAEAVREIAERERFDLGSSTAYSDSHTDLAFLETVGHPTAVNPDSRLREIAMSRQWPILSFVEPHRQAAAPRRLLPRSIRRRPAHHARSHRS